MELYLSGLTSVGNAGFGSIIDCAAGTLSILQMSLNDQPELTGEVCKAITHCVSL